jgi:hypothetical protein
MMSVFSFRQRVGRIDWHALTSIRLKDVITNTNIKILQNNLDNLIFSLISIDDIRDNSIQSLSKLINMLQLISEYLLYCQEQQFKVIRSLETQSSKDIIYHENIIKENISLKEDRKIYQRQIGILRKLLGPSVLLSNEELLEDNHLTHTDIRSKKGRISKHYNNTHLYKYDADYNSNDANDDAADGHNLHSNNNNNNVIIETIFKHEDENRVFLASLINDQRQIFLEQMKIMSDSTQHSSSSYHNRDKDIQLDNLLQQIEARIRDNIQASMDSLLESITKATQSNRPSVVSRSNTISDAVALPNTSGSATIDDSTTTNNGPKNRKRDIENILRSVSMEISNSSSNNNNNNNNNYNNTFGVWTDRMKHDGEAVVDVRAIPSKHEVGIDIETIRIMIAEQLRHCNNQQVNIASSSTIIQQQLQQSQSAVDAKEKALTLLEQQLKEREARLDAVLTSNTLMIDKLSSKNKEIQLARRSDEKERLDLLAINEMLKMTAETVIVKQIYRILHQSKILCIIVLYVS